MSLPLATFLKDLSTVVAWRLQSSAALREVAVLEARAGFVDNDVLNALGVLNAAAARTKTGACVIVMLPRIVRNKAQGPQGQLWVELTVKIHEMPLLNYGTDGTGISADEIMATVLNLLHTWSADTLGSALSMKDVPEVDARNENGEVIRVVQFEIMAPTLTLLNCAAPEVTVSAYNSGHWTLTGTSATAGATVKLLVLAPEDELVLDPDLADWATSPETITVPGTWRVLAVAQKAGLQMSPLLDFTVTLTVPGIEFVQGGAMEFVEGGVIEPTN